MTLRACNHPVIARSAATKHSSCFDQLTGVSLSRSWLAPARTTGLCVLFAILGAVAPAAEKAPPPANPPVPTVIESGSADMISTATETTFTFRQNVSVTATNMKMTCDELVVVAKRSGDPNATIGKQDNFKSLIATGNVRILQGDREATCGRAAVYPGDDKVELTENPVVRSVKEGWTQTGPKMILYRGERRAVVEGTATERPRLTLPALKDLGDLGQDGKKKKDAPPAKDAPGQPATKESPAPTPAPEAASTPTITVPIPPAPK